MFFLDTRMRQKYGRKRAYNCSEGTWKETFHLVVLNSSFKSNIMSPKDIKLNYFFNDPAVKENMLSEYLHYSIEEDIYTEMVDGGNVASDDYSHKSISSEHNDGNNELYFEKDRLMAVHDAGGVEWNFAQKENDNREMENNYSFFAGNHISDI